MPSNILITGLERVLFVSSDASEVISVHSLKKQIESRKVCVRNNTTVYEACMLLGRKGRRVLSCTKWSGIEWSWCSGIAAWWNDYSCKCLSSHSRRKRRLDINTLIIEELPTSIVRRVWVFDSCHGKVDTEKSEHGSLSRFEWTKNEGHQYWEKVCGFAVVVNYYIPSCNSICDPICKNPEQSCIFKNSDFCIMVFCIPKALVSSLYYK